MYEPTIPKVPVGPSTIVGYGAFLGTLALAVVAYLTGDHTQQTVGAIVSGAIALGSLLITNWGRTRQAQVLAHKAIAAYDTLPPSAQAEIESMRQKLEDALAELEAAALARVPLTEPLDEPGDILPGLAHLPTKSPKAITKDQGDAGADGAA